MQGKSFVDRRSWLSEYNIGLSRACVHACGGEQVVQGGGGGGVRAHEIRSQESKRWDVGVLQCKIEVNSENRGNYGTMLYILLFKIDNSRQQN